MLPRAQRTNGGTKATTTAKMTSLEPVTRWNTNTVGCSPRDDSSGWLTASPVSPSSTRKRGKGRNARSAVSPGSLPTAGGGYLGRTMAPKPEWGR